MRPERVDIRLVAGCNPVPWGARIGGAPAAEKQHGRHRDQHAGGANQQRQSQGQEFHGGRTAARQSTLLIGRSVMRRPVNPFGPATRCTRWRKPLKLNAELAARAWEFAQGLDLDEYRRLQDEVRAAWPATEKLRGLDFDRALLAFIAERWLEEPKKKAA